MRERQQPELKRLMSPGQLSYSPKARAYGTKVPFLKGLFVKTTAYNAICLILTETMSLVI